MYVPRHVEVVKYGKNSTGLKFYDDDEESLNINSQDSEYSIYEENFVSKGKNTNVNESFDILLWQWQRKNNGKTRFKCTRSYKVRAKEK